MKIQLDKFLQIVICFCFVVGLWFIPMKVEANAYIWPCSGSITSAFGWRKHPITGVEHGHSGIDIGADYGVPIVASASGTVTHSGWMQGYGYTVVISHSDGMDTLYGHCLTGSLRVAVGQYVTQNTWIASVGSTGNSTGPHCHFGMYPNHGDVPTDPADYLSGVPKGSTTPALDSARAKLKWDKEHDFGKPLFDIVKQVIDLLTESTKRISDTMQKLLFILLTIDLALAASLYTINPNANNQQYGIFGFLINKLLIYSILIWLVSNWSGFIFNTMRDFAVYSAGTALNAKNAELIKFIQDPFDILVKGIHIISPFFESAVMMALGDPISIICFCMMLIMGFVLAVIFFFISYNIAMAFIGFYFSCLFGFCTLFLSGFKHTRHHAEQGINGIFYATIKLLVFSFAGFIILGLMKEFAVDPFVKQEMTNTSIVIPTDGNFGGEEGVTVVAELIRIRESGGGEEGYYTYNVREDLGGQWSQRFLPDQGDGGYGAWQFTGGNYEAWGKMYEDEYGQKTLERVDAGNDYKNSPNVWNGHRCPLTGRYVTGSASGFSYCSENQRKIAEFMLLRYYKQYGNWKQAIMAWNSPAAANKNPETNEYYELVINGASGTIHRPQASVVFDFYIIFKLFVIALIFVYLFSKLNKTLESLLGGNGFRFTVRDFE